MFATASFMWFSGWVREVSERTRASGANCVRKRINRNERPKAATIEVAGSFSLKSCPPAKNSHCQCSSAKQREPTVRCHWSSTMSSTRVKAVTQSM